MSRKVRPFFAGSVQPDQFSFPPYLNARSLGEFFPSRTDKYFLSIINESKCIDVEKLTTERVEKRVSKFTFLLA